MDIIRNKRGGILSPIIKFCPYCGSKNLKYYSSVPRCMDCRIVFFARFSRKLRKAPTKNVPMPKYEITSKEHTFAGHVVILEHGEPTMENREQRTIKDKT